MTMNFVRATLTKVTGWTLDEGLVAEHEESGGLDRERLVEETKTRLDDCTDDGRDNLPYIYEFNLPGEPDEREVGDAVLEKFASEFYKDSYVFPSDGEFEWGILNTYEEE